MASKFDSDPAVMDALKEITGSDIVRTHKEYDPEGKPITSEGYLVNDQEYVFRNDKHQSVHVPLHRVEEFLAPPAADSAPAPAPPTDPKAPAKAAAK